MDNEESSTSCLSTDLDDGLLLDATPVHALVISRTSGYSKETAICPARPSQIEAGRGARSYWESGRTRNRVCNIPWGPAICAIPLFCIPIPPAFGPMLGPDVP